MGKARSLRWLAPVAAFFTIPMVTGLSPSVASAAAQGPAAVHAPALEKVQSAAAVPNGARALGAVAATASVSGAVVLKPQNEDAVKAFISEVTNKHSAQFHHYLAPGAYAARFGPTAATLSAVESALKSSGLTITSVTSDHLMVNFSGSVSKVDSAFHTSMESYRLADGTTGRGTTSAVQLPSSIAGEVSSVVGLDQLVHADSSGLSGVLKGGSGHPAAKTATFIHPQDAPTPCVAAANDAASSGGLTDDQIANAYGATPLYAGGDLGTGQHIAVYELEPFALNDLSTFDSCYGVSGTDRVSIIPVDGGQGAGFGSGEAILDVEDVSAIAPDANLDVYEAPNTTFGGIDNYAQIINNDTDQLVTSSWGLCEQAVQSGEPGLQQAENLLFEQAAAQGQTVLNSSGDTGSNNCNSFRTSSPVSPILSVSDPASQPYVLGVGGTTINNATQPPAEQVWNDGVEWGGGGGGISESWPVPSWQTSVLNPATVNPAYESAIHFEETSDPGASPAFCFSDTAGGEFSGYCRNVPDVSAQADEFTGAVTIYTALDGFGWITIGGTSSATPIWAALLALVNTSPTCVNDEVSNIGFASPLLYAVAANPATYATSFNDIVGSNNDIYGDSQMYPATPGYDMATGLGSPQLTGPGGTDGLATNLCAMAVSPTRPVVSGINPPVIPTANFGTPNVLISGSGFTGGGGVTRVEVGGQSLPGVVWSVDSDTQISIDMPPAVYLQPPGDTTDGAGAYQVTVTLADGETSVTNPNSVATYVDMNSTPAPLPTVTSVRTYGGTEAGGNTVQIYGAGFTGATDVTFGGVSVDGLYTVVSDHQITATVPAYDSTNTGCAQDGSSFNTAFSDSEDATNDICQVDVQVTTPNGSSAPSSILPLYEGAIAFNDQGVVTAPTGEEAAPQPTEYDYVPQPTITSISTVNNEPGTYASEQGGTVVTITGSGFNLDTMDAVYLADPTQAADGLPFTSFVFVSGTEIQLIDPGLPPSTDQSSLPLTVQTLAGLSNSVDDIWAGVPSVTGVALSGPGTGVDQGIAAGPATGGSTLTITGTGFTDSVPTGIPLQFVDALSPFSVGTQYNFTPTDDNTIVSDPGATPAGGTVPQNPALVDVQVCTVTACSSPTSFDQPPFGDGNPPPNADEMILYPPGAPSVTSGSPTFGPATGGTLVTLTGTNLGCVTNVTFGGVESPGFGNTPEFLDCGATNSIEAVAPPGAVGSTVPVHVTTVESDITGDESTSSATFHYDAVAPAFTAASPPAHAVVHIPYSYTFQATGDPAPTYSVSTGSLPPGLHLASVSGVLSGIPTKVGTYHFKVTASNSGGAATTSLLTITVVHASDIGYWEATSAGGVYPFGAALPHGSLGGMHLNKPIVGLAATPDGQGYWLVASDGGVFPFGTAKFYGSLGNIHLNKPIVAIAASPTGHGYTLVASDGGIFPFGDAKYHGSLGSVHLNQPIVGMAPTYNGSGYWLVAADGGVFPFGPIGFYGSGGSMGLGSSVAGIVATPDSQGYALVARTGAVIPFGDFTSFGSMFNQLTSPVIGTAIEG